MDYLALYRKWRPKTFSDVIGQSQITTTLKNEIIQNKLSHAYIFSGTRGTGKTSTAKILSRAINCTAAVNGNPCNECSNCKGILNGSLLDVVEMDAASNNSVNDIRIIRDEAKYAPSDLKYKVYIIDEAHMLSDSAFNALLKTLEEPPERVMFILATTEVHQIPVTILSRCQRFDFKRITPADIEVRLKKVVENENINIDSEAVKLLSYAADGSMRDALSILDRCTTCEKQVITVSDVAEIIGTVDNSHMFALADCIANKDMGGLMSQTNELVAESCNIQKLTEDITHHFRNLLVGKFNTELLPYGSDIEKYKAQSSLFTKESLINIITVLSKALNDEKTASDKRTVLEVALIKLCSAEASTNEALIARISELEKAVYTGIYQNPKKVSALQNESKTVPQPNKNEVCKIVEKAKISKETIEPADEPLVFEPKAEPLEEISQSFEPKEKETSAKDTPLKTENLSTQKFKNSYWANITSDIESENSMLASFLSLADIYIKNEELYVVFSDGFSYMFATQGNNKAVLENCIFKNTGKKLNVRFEEASDFDCSAIADTQSKELEKLQSEFPDIIKFED